MQRCTEGRKVGYDQTGSNQQWSGPLNPFPTWNVYCIRRGAPLQAAFDYTKLVAVDGLLRVFANVHKRSRLGDRRHLDRNFHPS
jgi:hypothetical protein